MAPFSTAKRVIAIPYIFQSSAWVGGAIYLANLVKILSSLPEGERPALLLLNPTKEGMHADLAAVMQQAAVAGVFRFDGTPQAVRPELRDFLLDAATGALRADAWRQLTEMTEATFPIVYSNWGRVNVRRPFYWIPDFQHKHLPKLFPASELSSRESIFAALTAAEVPLVLSSRAALEDCRRFYPQHRCRPHVWSFCSIIEAAELAGAPNPIATYGLPPHYFYIANQFWAHKDHRTAFRAIKLLRDRGFDATMVCTGALEDNRNSAYPAELQAFIRDEGLGDHIRILGVLPRSEQIGLFRYAAAVVQPSQFEGWSTVVEDARAIGRPVFLSDIAPNKEQMAETGIFFRCGDAGDLADVIARNWPRLRPGPDRASETRALAAGQVRRQECGRRFLEILAAECGPVAKAAAQLAAVAPPFRPLRPTLPKPDYAATPERAPAVCFPKPAGTEWYPPVMVGIDELTARLFSGSYVEAAAALLDLLDGDEYTDYVRRFYREGLARFGSGWRYADIVTVLLALSDLLKPRRYLEIGVRQGRSLSAVASRTPDVEVAAFDMWIQNYAGMRNPGPNFVNAQLQRIGYRGRVRFINGNSHETLPRFFAENPGTVFDLITVDGDHSRIGAAQDLCDVLPHLSVGGAIVFDDISHPAHPELREVWQTVVADDPRFAAWDYDDVGYGVGIAIRKY